MSTVQEIKAAIKALPDADFREVSRAVDEMEADRFDRALEDAAQSGKLDEWLKKVDADIDAGEQSRSMKSSTTPDFWESYYAAAEERARSRAQNLSAVAGESQSWLASLEATCTRALVGPRWLAISRTRARPRRHRLLVLDRHA